MIVSFDFSQFLYLVQYFMYTCSIQTSCHIPPNCFGIVIAAIIGGAHSTFLYSGTSGKHFGEWTFVLYFGGLLPRKAVYSQVASFSTLFPPPAGQAPIIMMFGSYAGTVQTRRSDTHAAAGSVFSIKCSSSKHLVPSIHSTSLQERVSVTVICTADQ
jgi:hypothetical protein